MSTRIRVRLAQSLTAQSFSYYLWQLLKLTVYSLPLSTVVDIWTIHPQQLAPSVRGTITSTKATSPRLPTNRRTMSSPTPQPPLKPDDTQSPLSPTNTQARTDRSPSSIPGEVGGMKYVACRDPGFEQSSDFSTVPRHWGEVVMTNRRQRKKRPAINGENGNSNGNLTDDLFGTLVVK